MSIPTANLDPLETFRDVRFRAAIRGVADIKLT